MRLALTRIDSNEGHGQENEKVGTEQPSYDLDEWQHLEKYAQGWRSAIKREGLDAVREKVEANTFPLQGSTRSLTSENPTDLDGGGADAPTNLGKVQFDAQAFHSWERRQLAMYQKEEKENESNVEYEKVEIVHGGSLMNGVKTGSSLVTSQALAKGDHPSNENNVIFDPPTRMLIESVSDYHVSSTPTRKLPPHTCSELDTMD